MEVIELPAHPWFVAVQCHPEFKSKPTQAHPLFRGFVKAALERRERKKLRPPPGARGGGAGVVVKSVSRR